MLSLSLDAQFWQLELPDFMPQLLAEPNGEMRFTGVAPGEPIPITRLIPPEVEELKRRLLASYDARSSYVHAGERRFDLTSSVQRRSAGGSERARPVEFTGLRTILRELVWAELRARSHPVELPDVHLFH